MHTYKANKTDSNRNITTQQKINVIIDISEDGNQEEHAEHSEGTSQEIGIKTQGLLENNDTRQRKIQKMENPIKEKTPPGKIKVEQGKVQISNNKLV